ncbi:ParA family protein [Entomospira culicis]|uniref:ParA family protein n=1 Tax=Entomospira culicis TaxID=2719989 RepID=A0A968GHG9_9SPIO|nr:ParA family protein [Entomospira culicis]NIZ19952.1 ParA family protein [Entomospira culicis]NIZ70183.1 ParA family protein [Entomospira culicis]WDI38016.1 ParA family protein [Entomospira culicis]WDI39639.1 ParA family protein [Entomospira culicis]
MKVITVSSIKGGVGKTTTTIYLGLALHHMGYKVAFLDIDHNNNLTDFFLRDVDLAMINEFNFLRFLEGTRTLSQVVYQVDGISIVPATPDLIELNILVQKNPILYQTTPVSVQQLFHQYDFLLIDTPPALGAELSIGLALADIVITPVSDGRWMFQGYMLARREVAKIAQVKPEIRHLALRTMVSDNKANLIDDPAFWGGQLLTTVINRHESVRNAVTKGHWLKENTKAFVQYQDVAKEVMHHLQQPLERR